MFTVIEHLNSFIQGFQLLFLTKRWEQAVLQNGKMIKISVIPWGATELSFMREINVVPSRQFSAEKSVAQINMYTFYYYLPIVT